MLATGRSDDVGYEFDGLAKEEKEGKVDENELT